MSQAAVGLTLYAAAAGTARCSPGVSQTNKLVAHWCCEDSHRQVKKEYIMAQTLLEMAKDLVLAQIHVHQLSPEDMHAALQHTYASMHALKTQEDTQDSSAVAPPETPSQPVNWRKSITKQTVTCLACGTRFKQLSTRHLREHGLDARSYRLKYGIPLRQPLSARSVTALRKQIVQRSRPWEKAPTYLKAHEPERQAAAAPPRPAPKKRTSRAKQ
jgi:predicted transcriptional regulator